jgi:hypothetical protein
VSTGGARCTCDEDVAEELQWLVDTMRKLEGEVVNAEVACRRWGASRGVEMDAIDEIYSYLTADFANECVACSA